MSRAQDSTQNRRETGMVECAGARLEYVREGSGKPIVVVGLSKHYSQAFSGELRERYELICVDSRHFAPSYQPSEEEIASVTLETLADDLDAMRSHFGFDEWIVLGQSFQAQIALAYAKKYSDRTSRLVLVAGVPYAFSEFTNAAEAFWNEHASEERKRKHTANRKAIEPALNAAPPSRRFAINYVGDAARYWVDPSYDATPLWEGVETSPVFGRLFESVPSRKEVRATLENLEMPTLVILGRLDYAIPYVVWEELIDDLPHLTYILLERHGHNPQSEFPEEFVSQLINWLQS